MIIATIVLKVSLAHAFDDAADPAEIGSRSFGLMSEPELIAQDKLECTIKKSDVKPEVATRSAAAIHRALKLMKFQPDEFNKNSLLHFLTQAKAESGIGSNLTQDGSQPAHKTGYGIIQVTGPGNLRQCEKCMDEIEPGLGNGIVNNPERTMGDSSQKGYDGDEGMFKAALCSLCWWKANMVENEKHNDYATSHGTCREVTQCVNAGGVPRAITGGESNHQKRQEFFNKIESAMHSCEQGAMY